MRWTWTSLEVSGWHWCAREKRTWKNDEPEEQKRSTTDERKESTRGGMSSVKRWRAKQGEVWKSPGNWRLIMCLTFMSFCLFDCLPCPKDEKRVSSQQRGEKTWNFSFHNRLFWRKRFSVLHLKSWRDCAFLNLRSRRNDLPLSKLAERSFWHVERLPFRVRRRLPEYSSASLHWTSLVSFSVDLLSMVCEEDNHLRLFTLNQDRTEREGKLINYSLSDIKVSECLQPMNIASRHRQNQVVVERRQGLERRANKGRSSPTGLLAMRCSPCLSSGSQTEE